ncbi:tripartite tricarboxylate transporter permease [Rhizobium halophytocola]|uniref:Tricarboxylic transport membrane protein n=1 Tax=Rhizobium halophytocola TaxID=735519 RepID=A0ABS4DV15_9HYPH|nr:tripartite tricarboxylate transporter permease [Rhizobium halophytocola]MBP1849515.1 putative tricarboxylic transport membrane protein [Rhizobium halophytocola]
MQGVMDALSVLFSVPGLASLLVGTALGIVVGALPGLGPSIGISLLIPFTYDLSPEVSMILLISLYMAAEYGGSVSAILLSTPGTAAAAATAIDGYAMTQNGRGNEALGVSLSASAVGGLVGGLALLVLAAPLAKLALQFGPAGYFAVGLFGLTSVAALSGGSLVKGLAGAAFGLSLAFIGIDPISGTPRFTFGFYQLFEGVPMLAALIGLFAVSEALLLAESIAGGAPGVVRGKVNHVFLKLADWKRLGGTMLSGSIIGTLLGILPGVGGNIACWVSRDFATRRHPDVEFGKGEPLGVAAPESANNATVGGAMVPLLALGVPGSPTTAVIVGALVMHGLRPGPQLFAEQPALVYTILLGVMLSAVALYIVGSIALPWLSRVVQLPDSVLAAGIMVFAVLGAYALRNLTFDIWLTLGFGLIGYLMKKLQFPVAPVVLALVLGYLVETNFRTALVTSQGSYSIFFTDPVSALFLVLSVVSIVLPLWRKRREKKAKTINPV